MANKIHYLKATMGGAHRHVHTTIALCERKHNVLVSESPFTLDESKVTCKRCLDHLHTRKVRAERRRMAPVLVLHGKSKYWLSPTEDDRSRSAWKVMTCNVETVELGTVIQNEYDNRFEFIDAQKGFSWSMHLRLDTAIFKGLEGMITGRRS